MRISAKRVALTLTLVAVFFYLLTLAVQYSRLFFEFGSSPVVGFLSLFFVAREGSIATWYSVALMLVCAVLLATIAIAAKQDNDRDRFYWAGLALIFVYVSADEAAEIHERLIPLGRFMLNSVGVSPTGALAAAWIVPAMLIMLALTLVYLRFYLRLPTRIRLLFFAAAAIFVTGAVGFELLAAFHSSTFEDLQSATPLQRGVQLFLPNTEELLEMLGTVVFIYALMSYLGSRAKEIKVRIE